MAIKKSLRDSFDYKFFVSRSQPSADSLKGSYFWSSNLSWIIYIYILKKIDGRITDEDLREALNQSNKDDLLCFLCGPPPMTDRFTSALQEMGVPHPNIRYEKWWWFRLFQVFCWVWFKHLYCSGDFFSDRPRPTLRRTAVRASSRLTPDDIIKIAANNIVNLLNKSWFWWIKYNLVWIE